MEKSSKPSLISYYEVVHPIQPDIFRMAAGTEENIASAMEYQAHAGDLFLCSYPKCGSTWSQNIVWRLLHNGNGMPGHIRDHIPPLEFVGAERVNELRRNDKYHIIRTHFPYKWVPKHPKAKYIFIYREPKDVCVSLYHHIKGYTKAYEDKGCDFNYVADTFLEGKLDSCDYFEMVNEWFEAKKMDSENSILILSYESLVTDFRSAILRIADFLGEEYREILLQNDEEVLNTIMKETAIAKMKENDKKWHGFERFKPFIRKGIIGDWKNHMTEEQASRFDRRANAAWKSTVYANADAPEIYSVSNGNN